MSTLTKHEVETLFKANGYRLPEDPSEVFGMTGADKILSEILSAINWGTTEEGDEQLL